MPTDTQIPKVCELPSEAAVRISAWLERAEQPQAGDKYIRADGRMTVEVTGVADNRISIECVDDGVCESRVWPLSTFQMLARKSIEFGAKFEAARSNE